jgi:hypothetical protein
MKKPLLLLAPVALLFLASCSSEPSDWRPEQKVSLDVIPPGTRISDNFDQKEEGARDPKHDPVGEPASKVLQGNLTRRTAPSAGAVMSADTKPENTGEHAGNTTSSQQADKQAEEKTEKE